MPDTGSADAGKDTGDGRAARWDSHRSDRQRQLLDAGIEAIEESGVNVGVRHVAERAGIPRSVVYRLFEDRDDFEEQLRARIVEQLMTDLAPTLAPHGTLQHAIHRAASTYVGWCADHPALQQYVGLGTASRQRGGSPTVTGTRTAIMATVAGLLSSACVRLGVAPRLAQPVANALYGLVDNTVNRWLARPDGMSRAELIEFLEVSIWNVIDGNLRHRGVILDPTTLISDLRPEESVASTAAP
ncbi:MAG TPA: TetR/AcrR family transcriptional regulator [Pseudonocardiaceae bacterium]|nr:TetR/AcrR family transcriptional regulator [Pseudonocardiaceae bacterium]